VNPSTREVGHGLQAFGVGPAQYGEELRPQEKSTTIDSTILGLQRRADPFTRFLAVTSLVVNVLPSPHPSPFQGEGVFILPRDDLSTGNLPSSRGRFEAPTLGSHLWTSLLPKLRTRPLWRVRRPSSPSHRGNNEAAHGCAAFPAPHGGTPETPGGVQVLTAKSKA
jgi:hypothetical protein